MPQPGHSSSQGLPHRAFANEKPPKKGKSPRSPPRASAGPPGFGMWWTELGQHSTDMPSYAPRLAALRPAPSGFMSLAKYRPGRPGAATLKGGGLLGAPLRCFQKVAVPSARVQEGRPIPDVDFTYLCRSTRPSQAIATDKHKERA